MTKITILGAGAFGSAIANLFADNGHMVTLWSYEPEVAHDIQTTRINKKYFPDFVLHKNIQVTTDLAQACAGAAWLAEAIPVKYLRNIFQEIKDKQLFDPALTKWLLLSKGIEQQTLLLPIQICKNIFGPDTPIVVMSGPNFAKELAHKVLSATTLASLASKNSSCDTLTSELSGLMQNSYFKTVTSDDPLGVQLSGAVKNVIALALGIAQGAGYKENTKAYILTQGLFEMAILTKELGGKEETVYGLSGLGDTVLTCTSTLSKNLRIGIMLGSGLSLEQVSEQISVLPEGINTVQSVHELIAKLNLRLPLYQGTYDCIFRGKKFDDVVSSLSLV